MSAGISLSKEDGSTSIHTLDEELEPEIRPPGTYSPGAATECTPCESGTFAPYSGAPGCYACPEDICVREPTRNLSNAH